MEALNQALDESYDIKTLREVGVEGLPLDEGKKPLGHWLRFPALDQAAVTRIVGCGDEDTELLEERIEDILYAPYVARQAKEIADLEASERLVIPRDFDYGSVPGLSKEMVEKLSTARPENLGAASRLRGITPAALSGILVSVRRQVSAAV